ncbi:MAG: transposase, partial [Mycobacteriales bacterium]
QLALIATYSYHAFITDMAGDAVTLDAWHRAHAVVENAIRDLKYGVGLNHLPSGRFGANAAWLALNVMAHNLSRWTARIGGLDIIPGDTTQPDADDTPAPAGETTDAADAADTPAPAGTNDRRPPRRRRRPGERVDFVATNTLRRRYLAVPGRLASSARTLTVHLPARWPWAEQFTTMLDAIRAVQAVT